MFICYNYLKVISNLNKNILLFNNYNIEIKAKLQIINGIIIIIDLDLLKMGVIKFLIIQILTVIINILVI